MHFALTTLFSALVASASLANASPAPAEAVTNGNLTVSAASFGINLGNTFDNIVAWVDGGSKCNNVAIAAYNTNPCGISFSLNGQSGFKVNGCGGSLWITKGSAFWANCGVFSEADECGVHTTYHCL